MKSTIFSQKRIKTTKIILCRPFCRLWYPYLSDCGRMSKSSDLLHFFEFFKYFQILGQIPNVLGPHSPERFKWNGVRIFPVRINDSLPLFIHSIFFSLFLYARIVYSSVTLLTPRGKAKAHRREHGGPDEQQPHHCSERDDPPE